MAPPVSDPSPTPTIVDGLRYLITVREGLRGETGKYEQILALIHSFNAGSMDIPTVVSHMEELLRGHTELLRDFNRFLPWSYIRAHGPAGGGNQ